MILWITVFDAWSKIPPGILEGNINLVGAYSECLNIVAMSSKDNSTFTGQYCQASLKINGDLLPAVVGDYWNAIFWSSTVISVFLFKQNTTKKIYINFTPYMTLGVCVPSSCTESDLSLYFYSKFIQGCGSDNHKWSLSLKGDENVETTMDIRSCRTNMADHFDEFTLLVM